MDLLGLLRTLGGLGIVLGLLAGALWLVRRYDIRLPGRIGGGQVRRLALVERLAIDGKRSVALVRRDGREHLLLLDPTGAVVIEAGIGEGSVAAIPTRETPGIAPAPTSFAAAVDALKAPAAVATVSVEDDMLPFHEALSRIQEKARRMRQSVGAVATGDGIDRDDA